MTKKAIEAKLQSNVSKISRKQFLMGTTAVLLGIPTSLSVVATTAFGQASADPKTSPVLPGELKAVEIAPGVFVHQGSHGVYTPENGGDISNCAFVIGDQSVAIIDTGGTFLIGQALKAAVRKQTDLPIKYVINTHMHPDHVFGNAAFRTDKPEFIAHAKMARGLAARAERYLAINKKNVGEAAFKGTEVVLPTRGIKSRETLDLGGRELVLEPQPTAHTDNDLVITDPKTGTLFLGDLLFSGHCPALDGSILGWVKVIDTVSARKGERVVPGHGPASMSWPEALAPMRRYLEAITVDVRRLIEEGRTLRFAMKSVANQEEPHWQLFEEFHRRNIAAAFAELEWE